MTNPHSHILVEVSGEDKAKDAALIAALKEHFIGYEIRSRKSADKKYRTVEAFIAKGAGVTDMKGNDLSGGAALPAAQEIIYRLTGHHL